MDARVCDYRGTESSEAERFLGIDADSFDGLDMIAEREAAADESRSLMTGRILCMCVRTTRLGDSVNIDRNDKP